VATQRSDEAVAPGRAPPSSAAASSRRLCASGTPGCDVVTAWKGATWRESAAKRRAAEASGSAIPTTLSAPPGSAARGSASARAATASAAGRGAAAARGRSARRAARKPAERRDSMRPRRSRPSRGAAASGLETRAVLGGAREAGEAPGPLYRRGQLSAAPARHGRACGREAVPDAASIPYALRSRWHRRSADTGRGLAARAPDAAALATRGTHGGACCRRGQRCGTARFAAHGACGDCRAGTCDGSAGRVVAVQQTR
jgi:hypothetical protein